MIRDILDEADGVR
jgi:hypothetical protein